MSLTCIFYVVISLSLTSSQIKINEITVKPTLYIWAGIFHNTYNNQKDIDRNLIKYNILNGTLKRNFGKQMRKKIQLRFHNIVSKLALLYGSECWTFSQRDKSRINSSKMRFLHSLSGVTLRDRIKSEEIMKQWKVEVSD
jgi:hypothetical protein